MSSETAETDRVLMQMLQNMSSEASDVSPAGAPLSAARSAGPVAPAAALDAPEEEEPEEPEEPEEDAEGIGERKNPVWSIGGKDFDRDTVIVGVALIAIWVMIWVFTGLWAFLTRDRILPVVFVLFILYVITNVWTSGTSSGGVVYELNILLTVEQMVSILFGTVIMFLVWGNKLPVHSSCRPLVFRITLCIVLVLTIASLWVNVWTSGQAFRALRKFKQGVYNIALALFIVIALIYFRGSACPAATVPGLAAKEPAPNELTPKE